MMKPTLDAALLSLALASPAVAEDCPDPRPAVESAMLGWLHGQAAKSGAHVEAAEIEFDGEPIEEWARPGCSWLIYLWVRADLGSDLRFDQKRVLYVERTPDGWKGLAPGITAEEMARRMLEGAE